MGGRVHQLERGVIHAQLLARLDETIRDDPWSAASWAAELDHAGSWAWVATVDEAVVGVLSARVVGDEAEVMFVGVQPEHRGRRHAAGLLAVGRAELLRRGVRTWHLEVRAGNEPAIRCYTRCGFVRVGLRRRYYPDGEDAVLMTREEPGPVSEPD